MLSSQNISGFPVKFKYIYFAVIITLSLGCVFSLLFEYYKLSYFIFAIPFVIFALIYFNKYFTYFFIASLFVGGYFQWPLRVHLGLILAFALLFYFITYRNENIFNDLVLPSIVKKSALAIISAVYLSSFLTPHFSFFTVYYATLFFIFVLTSYVLFRSVKNVANIDKLIYYFVLFNFISCLTVILQILYSGNLRSWGIVGMSQMDFAAFAFVVIIFRNYLLSKTDNKSILYAFAILIVLITTQSRFAWLGFMLTFVYGIFICSAYSKDAKAIIKKRIPIFIFILLMGVSLVYITGLDQILLSRFSANDFTLFETKEGMLISNSMETRVLIWIVAFNTFIHNPLTGVGYLMFSETSAFYNILPDFFFNTFVAHLDAHTTYMNFLCETGLIGLSCFVFYVVTIFRYSLKSIKISRTTEEIKVSIILNLLVFFVMVHSIYSGAFTMGQNAFQMHFVFGLAIANHVILKRNGNVQKVN